MAYYVKYQNINYLSQEWIENRGRHYRIKVFTDCPIGGECTFLVQPDEEEFLVGGEVFKVIGCSDDDEEP